MIRSRTSIQVPIIQPISASFTPFPKDLLPKYTASSENGLGANEGSAASSLLDVLCQEFKTLGTSHVLQYSASACSFVAEPRPA